MAYDAKPSTWLGAGYASSSVAHTITLNTNDAASNKTLPELTDAEADPTSGDVRKLYFALLEALYQSYNATAAADRPTKMAIYRSSTVDETTGNIARSYSVQFSVVPSGIEVIAEPVP